MTDDEIRRSWRNRAGTAYEHVEVLAELNGIDSSEMLVYLQKLGLIKRRSHAPPKPPRHCVERGTWVKALTAKQGEYMKLHNMGLGDKAISDVLGIPPDVLRNYRRKNNIPTNRRRAANYEEEIQGS